MKKKRTLAEKRKLAVLLAIGVFALILALSLYLNRTADRSGLILSAEGDLSQGIKGIQIRSEHSFSGEDKGNTEAKIIVDIKGEVIHPGVYTLAEGARLADVIEMAGGIKPEASTRYLNLAQRVYDGMMIYIPSIEEAVGEGVKDKEGTMNGKININFASQQELEQLPGIGPSKAQAIIRYREQHGLFKSLEDLQSVPGIGPSTFRQLEPYIIH